MNDIHYFKWDQLGKSVNIAGKNALKSVKLQRSFSWKTNKDIALKVTEFYRRLYVTCSIGVPLTIQTFPTQWCNIFTRFGRIAFKLGKLTNFKAFFPAVSIDIRSLLFIKTSKKKSVEESILTT